MENSLFESTITHKLYKERAVFIGTFLGGPLAGGLLLAQNFKSLEQPENATKTWLLAIFGFLLIIATAFIPVLDQLPAFVYSLACCLATHGAARKFQGKDIVMHQANGGRFYSSGRAAFIGISLSIILVVLIFALLYLIEPAGL